MLKLAIYGKGGIGKLTTSANLSAALAELNPAVSANLSELPVPRFLSEEFQRFIDNTAEELNQV